MEKEQYIGLIYNEKPLEFSMIMARYDDDTRIALFGAMHEILHQDISLIAVIQHNEYPFEEEIELHTIERAKAIMNTKNVIRMRLEFNNKEKELLFKLKYL